jgi:hypothetical protein
MIKCLRELTCEARQLLWAKDITYIFKAKDKVYKLKEKENSSPNSSNKRKNDSVQGSISKKPSNQPLTSSNDLYKLSFLKKDAIAGFSKSGLFPFDRSKITNEDLSISFTFHNSPKVNSDENNKSNASEDLYDEDALITRSLSEKNKHSNMIKSINKHTSITARNLEIAILTHFQTTVANNQNKKKNKRVKRTFGEILTEDDVIERMQNEAQSKSILKRKSNVQNVSEKNNNASNIRSIINTSSYSKRIRWSDEKENYPIENNSKKTPIPTSRKQDVFKESPSCQSKWAACEECWMVL